MQHPEEGEQVPEELVVTGMNAHMSESLDSLHPLTSGRRVGNLLPTSEDNMPVLGSHTGTKTICKLRLNHFDEGGNK